MLSNSRASLLDILDDCMVKGSQRLIDSKNWSRSLLLTAFVVNFSAQLALADTTNNDDHSSLLSVPSGPEDFVRAPDLNTRDLAQPRPGDFRYMKMNYGKSKGSERTDPTTKTSSSDVGTSNAVGGPEKTSAASNFHGDRLGPIDLTPLNLTGDQKQKIQDMRHDAVTKARELRKSLRAKREDLLNATFDPDMTEAAIREKKEAVRTAHEQLEDVMFAELMSLRSILTPEQRKHLPEVKPQPRLGGAMGPMDFASAHNDARSSDLSKVTSSKNDTTTKSDGSKSTAKSDSKSTASKSPQVKD